MTCTHAALKRREFLSLAFKYDNLVMEEAAQILEVETFIPMVLQSSQVGGGGSIKWGVVCDRSWRCSGIAGFLFAYGSRERERRQGENNHHHMHIRTQP